MAKTDLTAQRLRELLHYDPETGVFTRRIATGWNNCHPAGVTVGWITRNKYRSIDTVDGRYYAHRLAWLYVHGEHPAHDIDHIDGNRDNNAIANLRDVTRSENLQNQRKPRSDNCSGLLGVSWSKERGKWLAQITHSGKQHNLGLHETKEAAHAAYLRAKRKHHPGCTL